MESPRRPSNAMVKHASARKLFPNNPDRSSRRSHGSSNEGHARRRLVLVPDDQAAGEDDGIREPSVVARLMGLGSISGEEEASLKLSPLQAKMNGEVTQLQELLKVKEPFLLGELLREAEDQPSSNNRKPSLIQKFTGFLKRRPAEINVSLKKSLFDERQKKQLVLSPVKSPRNVFASNSNSSKVSPIKSSCKSKRGLMLEAAVKFLDIDQPQQQQHSRVEKQQEKRKFSLSRSSSEPCLNSASSMSSSSSGKVNIKGELKGGLSKLSENVGRELSKRFGLSTGSASSTAASAFKNQSNSRSSSSSNLFRSKSDLGLGKTKHQVGGLGLLQQQQQAASCTKQDRNEQDPSFSQTAKTEAIKNSSGIGIRRLFGNHRCKDNRTTSDGRTDTTHSCTSTTTSGEASSLVRSLLLRRRNASTKTAFQRCKQVKIPPAGMDKISQSSSEVSIDDLSSSTSESLPFSGEFSDDSTRSVSSESPSNSRLDGNKSGQPSPVSVLEASFVDEIHTPVSSSSSSVEDSPEASSRDSKHGALSSTSGNIMNAILDISRIRCIDLSAIGIDELPCLQNMEDASTYVDEVLTTSQLLCEEQSSGKDWFCEGLPINLETFDIMEKKLSSNSRPKASLQARKLIFHCVDEAVDARLSCFRGKAGSSAARQRKLSKQEIVAQIHGQITDWSSMSSCSTDELVEKDMNSGRGKWTDWNEEVNEIIRDLECSLIRKMIEEVAREIRGLT